MYHIFFIHSAVNGHREQYCKCFFVQERVPLSWVYTWEWDCWAAGRAHRSLSGRCHIVLLALLCWVAECAHCSHPGPLLMVFCVRLSLTLCLIFFPLCPNVPLYSFYPHAHFYKRSFVPSPSYFLLNEAGSKCIRIRASQNGGHDTGLPATPALDLQASWLSAFGKAAVSTECALS